MHCDYRLCLWIAPLVLMLAAPAFAQQPDDADPNAPFAAGSWTVQAYGSGTTGDSDHGQIYTGHLGFGYYFQNDLSINVEGLFGAVDTGPVSGDDDGIVGGLDVLFRYHYLNKPGWSLYADGGAGFQQADTKFPSDSHHNFRLLAGIGATLEVRHDWRLMGGVRYLHISNANTTSGNNGLDAAQLYLGLMTSF